MIAQFAPFAPWPAGAGAHLGHPRNSLPCRTPAFGNKLPGFPIITLPFQLRRPPDSNIRLDGNTRVEFIGHLQIFMTAANSVRSD